MIEFCLLELSHFQGYLKTGPLFQVNIQQRSGASLDFCFSLARFRYFDDVSSFIFFK